MSFVHIFTSHMMLDKLINSSKINFLFNKIDLKTKAILMLENVYEITKIQWLFSS